MQEAAHRQLPQWLDPSRRSDAPVDLGTLKASLARQGVNGRGWRIYLDYGDAIFSPLGRQWIHPDQPFFSGPNALAYLRILQACEMDVLPPPELVGSLQMWPLPNNRLDTIPPLFFRSAWKAAVANQYEHIDWTEFFMELTTVASWFFSSGAYETVEPGVLKAGWPTLLRRQKAWALEQGHQAPPIADPAEDDWDPYIRRVEWGLYRFQALTSAGQLREEGEAMQHCVGDYTDCCRAGIKRIYSVRERKSGLRKATLSVGYIAGGKGVMVWEIDQISGRKNAEILSPEIFFAADAVLRAYFDLPVHAVAKPVWPARPIEDEGEWYCVF